MPTTFTKVLGQEKLDISSSAQVKWGVKKLELALVLDNTGSMASNGKMTELKTASKSLLTTLEERRQAARRRQGRDRPVRQDREYRHRLRRAAASSTTRCTTSSRRSGRAACEDRDQPNDTLDTAPTLEQRDQVSGAVNCSGITSIMPLTDVLDTTGFTNLNSKIDAMNPAGNTNVTIGLVWGWHALTKSEPMTQG